MDRKAQTEPDKGCPRTHLSTLDRGYKEEAMLILPLKVSRVEIEQEFNNVWEKKQHDDMVSYEMIEHLKELYQGQAWQERFNISRALFQCKLAEGSPVGPHVLQMIGNIESLSKLGFPLSQEWATNVILQSLPDSYS
ncbi:uncharacterized protein LOC105771873 [Gossypium raimondii]|uniref:uncharacterized protein LOC105771873 n=1 Tax=Gossypium raimondii TaxID=29730 RepID=UPI00063AEA0A|nr:uncharacterized protein LOC105771873 [Gossypium raimondii]